MAARDDKDPAPVTDDGEEIDVYGVETVDQSLADLDPSVSGPRPGDTQEEPIDLSGVAPPADQRPADGDLVDDPSHVADVWQEDGADDLEERADHTTVDHEIGRRFMEEHGDLPPVPAPEPPSLEAPADAAALPVEDTDPPLPQPLIPGADAHIQRGPDDLGPAFPEDEAPATAGPPTAREPQNPAEVPTSARPAEPSYDPEAAPSGADQDGQPAVSTGEDAWAGFDDSGGWPRPATGESGVIKPPAKSEKQYTRRDTNVYKLGKPAPATEEGARLVCIAGADQGQEFPVNQREVSVGRIPANTIVLNDQSVSREHARLLFDGQSYTLVDLRSANGTFVNGNRIDRAKVRSGDEVGFGHTRFRFFEIGDVFKPVDAGGAPVLPGARPGGWRGLRQNPNFKSLVIAVGILSLTMVTAGVILVVRYGGSDARPRRETVFQYYLQGVEAFKRRQWTEAESHFMLLLGLDPAHARGQRYLEEVGKERRFEQQLAQARQAREAGDLAQSYVQAAAIVDSLYTPQALEIMRGIDAELDARVARARMELDGGNPAAALALLEGVDAVRPGRPDVLALRDRAAALAGGEAPPAPVVAETAPRESSPRREERPARVEERPARAEERPARVEERPARGEPPRSASAHDRALALFADGNLSEALSVLDAAGDDREAKILRAKIDKFAKVYEEANGEYRAKRTQTAIKQLIQAKAFESKVTGRRTKLTDEIDRKLADMHYVQGISSYLNQDFAEAYRNFKAAVALAPGHSPSLRKLDDLAVKAKELFEEGYRLKDSDPAGARERWRKVLQVVPSSNEHYKKAQQWLDSLP